MDMHTIMILIMIMMILTILIILIILIHEGESDIVWRVHGEELGCQACRMYSNIIIMF